MFRKLTDDLSDASQLMAPCYEEMLKANNRTQSHQSRITQCSRMLKERETAVYLLRCTKIRPRNPRIHRKPPRTSRHPDHHSQTQWRKKIYHAGIQGKNQYTGTGFLIEEFLNPSHRISIAKIQLDDDHCATIIVVAYAPTFGKSEINPSIREKFYDQLNSLTSEVV